MPRQCREMRNKRCVFRICSIQKGMNTEKRAREIFSYIGIFWANVEAGTIF